MSSDLIDKNLYYQISKENQVPKRCPILNRCVRNMWTKYLYNASVIKTDPGELITDIAKRQRWLTDDVEVINIIGEEPGSISSTDSGYFENMCPEVSLFDTFYSYHFTHHYAATKINWDEYQENILECRHFTECAEYSSFIANKTANAIFQQKNNDLAQEVWQILGEYFDEEELKNLCFTLGVNFQDLPATGRINKARELVTYFQRKNQLNELIRAIKNVRPSIEISIETSD